MAAKFPDVLEDADPNLVSGDDMSLKSNQQAISAKQILEGCGLSVEEIEDIASEYDIDIYQAAEKAEQLANRGLSSESIFKHLMKNTNPAQRKVQTLITSAVSGKSSGENVADVGNSQSQTGNMETAPSFVSHSSAGATCGDDALPHSTSFPSPTELDGLVDEEDMPHDLKEGQFDIFLLFCEDDNIEALKFIHFLEQELKLRVCYIGENFVYKRNQFETLEEAIKRSLYTFIFVTDTMINDKWTKFKHDAALAESIQTNGEFVIPVRAENCKVPFSLQPLTALRIYHIIDDLPDHPMFADPPESNRSIELTSNAAKQIPFVKNQIVKLVGAKERLKKRRLQMDEEKKQQWKDQEKIRIYEETIQKQMEQDMRWKDQTKQIQEIYQRARLNVEEKIASQEAEKIREMERMRILASQGAVQDDFAKTLQLLQQLGQTGVAENLMKLQFQSVLGNPSVHYHLPAGINPSELAPRPEINLQISQVDKFQLGDQNQMVQETAIPPNQITPVLPGDVASHNKPHEMCYSSAVEEVTGRPVPVAESPSLAPPHQYGRSYQEAPIVLGSDSLEEESITSQVSSVEGMQNNDRCDTTENQTIRKEPFTSISANRSEVMNTGTVSFDRNSENEGSLSSEVARFSSATNLEGTSFISSVTEERELTTEMESTSGHNLDSAQEHFNHPPGENQASAPQVHQEDALNIIASPAGEIDMVSIRSMPHPTRPNQQGPQPGSDRHFPVNLLNQSQLR